MIKIIKGDVVQAFKVGTIDILAHGVNCSGAFRSGIAGQIANHYHEVQSRYFEKLVTCEDTDDSGWRLGDIQPVLYRNPYNTFDQYIINCGTQQRYGRNANTCYVDYNAIEECMHEVLFFAKEKYEVAEKRFPVIGIPRIGAGLGGGDWEKIENIILKVFDKYDINVYVLEN